MKNKLTFLVLLLICSNMVLVTVTLPNIFSEKAGVDGVFYEAMATIKKILLFLHADKVKNPQNIRFDCGNAAQYQLFNKENLLVSSFISE